MASQFWLDEGILILSASYDGRGNLVTQLIDEQARTVGRLNIGRGATELKQIVRVPHPGNYVLDVRAIGSWSITIEPGEGPSIPTPFAPKALTGTGTALTDRFELEQRPYVFRITWRGSRSFRMSLVQEDGRSSSTIATGKGSGQISKTVRVPRPGRYLFDVRGDGDWSVSVELLSD
ncbi:MAG: hypothetical protein HY331_04285 [Chloroflexi bacterium]|nr:hypothetical protein [Chloroflexota bacterium]